MNKIKLIFVVLLFVSCNNKIEESRNENMELNRKLGYLEGYRACLEQNINIDSVYTSWKNEME